jgi:hypothetical protein
MIFAVKNTLEKSWEWNIEQNAMFIDMKKALGRVPREKIWAALRHPDYEIPSNLIRAIKSIYKNY